MGGSGWVWPRRVLAVAAASALVACGSPADPVAAPNSQAPVRQDSATATTTPAPSGPAVPSFSAPYPVGEKQASAPPARDGRAPVVTRIETTKPVVFITIDDGAVRDPAAIDLVRRSNARPTLFLTDRYVENDHEYFRQLRDAGATIENHTLSHPDLKGRPYDAQRREICATADKFGQVYGRRPVFFRPPYGKYDGTTLRAAADCGMRAVVNWTAAVNDGVVQFQAGNRLRPGDIVLMHFRKTFVADYQAFLNRAAQDGLTPVPLGDFLG
ncbi:Polysaccharide deacetylase [Streptoalloteichus tenebrarius]|uniref:Polysaccharide deacetylase n=1 Tax=Streptoalloteichus tenebrarius (strain ATCC 17920 / DSM 40477 / JCM 4838 / CBS 697.72 / NBRC 16177 / NCIMB 11028 / NRRL B-12390 / A12253. 1 / ISP 5477) TaxID=1933 RepID=A0ABT1HZ02_STRSD|nr:polysaccharide deacetylase family protein [Streptoalloteichus tenebrarius]MCP2260762.1 Polysaccharide deacetylase [Streptoalloteichus tenebrarius]BFF03424.1 polysaccharide deacetylase family protein [Streptoalloteichus tenebrarius]